MGTGEELIGQVVAMLDEQHARQREARQAMREVRRDAAEDRIGALRTQADYKLAAGVVEAGASAASGIAGGTGAKKDVTKTMESTGQTAGAALNFIAESNGIDAEAHELAETTAGDAVQDMTEAMQQTQRLADKALEHLEATLEAQVASQRAAIRQG
jgi:hypothetical protein